MYDLDDGEIEELKNGYGSSCGGYFRSKASEIRFWSERYNLLKKMSSYEYKIWSQEKFDYNPLSQRLLIKSALFWYKFKKSQADQVLQGLIKRRLDGLRTLR